MPQPTGTPLLPSIDLPPNRSGRILLFTIRRMALFGLNDAHATHAVFAHFGLSYRRPLILIRALMAEIARASTRTVTVAPCCCIRMTRDEARLIEAIEGSLRREGVSNRALGRLMDTAATLGVLTTAQAVAQCFFDLGQPLSLYDR